MKTLTIEIPESVDLDEREAKLFLAAKLYENGSLSLGHAAALAGVYQAFIYGAFGELQCIHL